MVVVDRAGEANDGNNGAHDAEAGQGVQAARNLLRFDQAFEEALAILRGTGANFVLCIATMLVSLASAVVGFLLMSANNTCARALMIMSIFFLVSQTFSVVKTVRDSKMASLLFDLRNPGDANQENNPYVVEYSFLLPTWHYKVEVGLTFLFSLGATIFSITQVDVVDPEWIGFTILTLIWVLQCALCLAKTVRDRKEAGTWQTTRREHQEAQLPLVLSACTPTRLHQAMIWIAFPAALIFTLVWTWLPGSIDIPIERKGFLSLGLVFNASACFHMAKLARDRANPQKKLELSKQIPFQLMVTVSFVVSIVVPLVGLVVMPLTPEQRAFLIVGFLMCASSTMHLAKLVRDRQELVLLNEKLPDPAAGPNGMNPMAQAARNRAAGNV